MKFEYNTALDDFLGGFNENLDRFNSKQNEYRITGSADYDKITLTATRNIPLSYNSFIKWSFNGRPEKSGSRTVVTGRFCPNILRIVLFTVLFFVAVSTLAYYIICGRDFSEMLPPIIIIAALLVMLSLYCIYAKREKNVLISFLNSLNQ